MKRLKAYEVRDDYEGHCVIRFATNGATARREGAGELGIEWDDVESCRRRPQFDQYAAAGFVPALVLIEHGWWFECAHCQRRVSEDMANEIDSEGLDPDDFEPVADGRHVYCSHRCAAVDYAERRARKAAFANLLEVAEAKFPGAKILHAHVAGMSLEPRDKYGHAQASVVFRIPGAKDAIHWSFGEDICSVSREDVAVYCAWRGKPVPDEYRVAP